MRENNGSALVKWLAGCGVVAVIGLAIIVVGGYFAAKKAMSLAGQETAKQIAAQYQTLKSENKVPAEHAAVFDDLVATSQDPTASLWTVALVMLSVVEPLSDGTVTPEEAKTATTIRDFVKPNPDCTIVEFSKFFEAHPELQELQQKMQNSPMGMPQPSTS